MVNITSSGNDDRTIEAWKRWIWLRGPLLVRVMVGDKWYAATANGGKLEGVSESVREGGHAACIVGYGPGYFIVRNSWGEEWGDRGYGYADHEYALDAFAEVYGITMPGDGWPISGPKDP